VEYEVWCKLRRSQIDRSVPAVALPVQLDLQQTGRLVSEDVARI